jgi:ATP-dependent RNA helicase DeaD
LESPEAARPAFYTPNFKFPVLGVNDWTRKKSMVSFKEMGLSEEILQSISELGFEKPTEIQEKVIPVILSSGEDLIGLAQTGTGKTAGFGLPLIQQIDTNLDDVQALILCPTRELCLQIARDFKKYSLYTKQFKTVAVYGGANIETQIKGLRANPQVVVGTPGRTLDLIRRKRLNLGNIRWLVLDEADEMLNMGFRDDLDDILSGTPPQRQTLLFSATMPNEIRTLTKKYMNKPVEIVSGTKNEATRTVSHELYIVRAADRYLALKRLVDINPKIYGIIFCRTRAETRDVADQLINDGYSADALHGDLSQAQRDTVMDAFRKQHIQLLVATDVAARGLDINNLTHVLNYNMPDDPEVYIHRSGRTGRAGKEGISVMIAHAREGRRITELEKLVGQKFKKKPIPTGEQVVEKRLYALMDNIENIIVDEDEIAPYWEQVQKKLSWINREDLLKRFVYVEFNRFIEYYKNAKDLNVSEDDRRVSGKKDKNGKEKRGRSSSSGFTRFFINLGEKNNIQVHNLIGLINEKTRSRDIEIGKVDIMRNFSFFEVDSEYTSEILKAFEDANHAGVSLNVEVAKSVGAKSGAGAERDNKFKHPGSGKFSDGDKKYKKKKRKDRY